MKYDALLVENDFITHKKHLFYLVASASGEKCWYIVASYSAKTDKIIIKDCSNFIPSWQNLTEFVEIAKRKYKDKGEIE